MVTVGVEEEFLLLDAERGHPVSRWDEVRASAGSAVRAVEVQRELLRSQIELVTPVCRHLEEVAGHLGRLREVLHASAAATGCRLAASGAAPFPGAVAVTDRPRYLGMLEDACRLVEEQVINGMHVHVGVPDRNAAVAALNRLRPWLPVLVAMSANSPYCGGTDTGFASWRTLVFDRWPVSGPPPVFRDADDYRCRTADLLAAGVIRDRRQLYWQARLSERYPTLEVRALDVQLLPEDAVVFAGLVRALVATSLADQRAAVPFSAMAGELLAAANWRSARHGLDGDLVGPEDGRLHPAADVVGALLERITPALRAAGDLRLVGDGVRRLLRDGTGARRQRRAMRAGGPTALLDLLSAGGRPVRPPAGGPLPAPAGSGRS